MSGDGVLHQTRTLLLLSILAGCAACGPLELARYALAPDPPRFEDGESVVLPGLRAPVAVARRPDGLWRVEAEHEDDALRVLGYLQARDRMAQLDLFRHMARGELAALLGNVPLGESQALELDLKNRFLGFGRQAERLWEATSARERESLAAFSAGIDHWIENGRPALEHRLLGVEALRPWTPVDSLAIYAWFMHGLSGNADREIRRLWIACEAGLEAMERVWPTAIEFAPFALPQEDLPRQRHRPAPAVVPELVEALPELCARAGEDRRDPFVGPAPTASAELAGEGLAALAARLAEGWSASNNWAVAGRHTRSGRPLLATDPHLPHTNPPLLWGFEVAVGAWRAAGFTLPGVHRIVFGHNGRVAWGATTNHVDRQDLVLHRRRVEDGALGYELEGRFEPFAWRRETFEVRGASAVEAAVRFTRDGPLLNDLEPGLRGRVPLVALRVAPLPEARDLDAARGMERATRVAEFAEALAGIDLGCSSWLFADAEGGIAFRSPCVLPRRQGWSGTFPVPGWSDRYRWRGTVPKTELPASTDPARGWLATANGQILPSHRFPTAYNNDASQPNRWLRIRARLAAAFADGGLDRAASEPIQLDVGNAHWRPLVSELGAGFCAAGEAPPPVERARRQLCTWDGRMEAGGVEPTLYTLLTNHLLDLALADELDGEGGRAAWDYAQGLLQFEANVAWLWQRPARAPVWDDARTPVREGRRQILEKALTLAVEEARRRWGADDAGWAWGDVRPFVLRHLFAPHDGLLGRVVNSAPAPIAGGNETVFKQQFPRRDRERMASAVGPVVRINVDLADPWAATFSLAGGESGWPRSAHYGDLLDDWRTGRPRPLTPAPTAEDVRVRFVPAGSP